MESPGGLPDLLGQICIYPVELVFPLRSGFTLWGGNVDGGEHDFFLTGRNDKVLLVDSLSELEHRTPTEGGGPLTEVEGFRLVMQALMAGETIADDDPIDRIDYFYASLALAQGSDAAAGTGGSVTDCLNATRDLAKQLRDDEMLSRLQNDGEPLRTLYYFLSGEEESPDSGSTKTAFDEMVNWFLTHVE